MKKQPKQSRVRLSVSSLSPTTVQAGKSPKYSVSKEIPANPVSTRGVIPQLAQTKTEEDLDLGEEKGVFDIKMSDFNFSQKVEVAKGDINFSKHIDEVSKCNCNVCFESRHKKKIEIDMGPEAAFFMDFMFDNSESGSPLDKDFVFVLKRLAPQKNMINGFRLFVPDTACFMQGECKFIVFTGKDKTLKYIKQKERLTLAEIRKFFDERRRKKDDEFASGVEEFASKKTKDDLFLTSVFDGKEMSRNESKIDNSSSMASSLMMSIVKPIKKFGLVKGQISDNLVSKEVGLIRFQDDSATMMTEKEFNYILLKKKIDPIWKNTQYLQNSMRIKYHKKTMHTLTRVYFVYNRDKENPLFKRALSEIKYLSGIILKSSEEYIPQSEEQKFEEELKANNERDYCLYVLCKIYHFLEVVSDVKVLKMGADFARDETGIMWLTHISRLQYQILETESKDDTPLRDRREFLVFSEKELFNEETDDPNKEAKRVETIKLLNGMLSQHYKSMKKKTGFDLPEIYYEDSLTDEGFARLHPKAPFVLQDVLRKSYGYEQIKEFLIQDTTRLLYPNVSKSAGNKIAIYSKYTYIGSPPRILPGMYKKSDDNNSTGVGSMPNLFRISGALKSRENPYQISPKGRLIHTSHQRLKDALGKTFINTGLNVKPSLRDTFFRPSPPIEITEIGTRPKRLQAIHTAQNSPPKTANGQRNSCSVSKHFAMTPEIRSPMSWTMTGLKETMFKDPCQAYEFHLPISQRAQSRSKEGLKMQSLC